MTTISGIIADPLNIATNGSDSSKLIVRETSVDPRGIRSFASQLLNVYPGFAIADIVTGTPSK